MFSRVSRSVRAAYQRAANVAAAVAGGSGAVAGSFSMAGEGDLSVSGTVIGSSSFTMDGEGDFSVTGTIGVTGTFSMAGEGGVTATGAIGVTGSFSMAGEGGMSATGTVGFDPASISGMTGLWRASYPGNTWPGEINSKDLYAAVSPDVGTAVNGYDPADFNGTDDNLQVTPGTLTGLIGSTAAAGWILINPDSTTGDILLDSNLVLVVGMNSGVAFLAVNGTDSVSRTISSGAWSLITWRYDGSNIQVGVNESPGANGGGSTQAYTTSLSPLNGTVYVGNGLAFGYLNGKILEIGIANSAISNSDFAKVKTYVNNRYGLSL